MPSVADASLPWVLKVAVKGPFLEPLDYAFPEDVELKQPDKAWVGCRVEVPFRQKTQVALVVGVAQSEYDTHKIKPIVRKIDSEPIVSVADLALWQWVSDYYQSPLGEVIQAALPKRLRAGEPVLLEGELQWTLSSEGKLALAQISRKTPAQHALAQAFLQAASALGRMECQAITGSWRKWLTQWQASGWVLAEAGPCWQQVPCSPRPAHRLNSQQSAAVNALDEHVKAEAGFVAFLLQGITGSGKTEVYLAMTELALQQHKQVLILVPEIGLTPQMIDRFSGYLQRPIAVLHSGMNDRERHCAWQAVRSGQISVLLGTRSAIFTPFANLGLCIIDEEHDTSYKQQDGVRYSARDLLVRRAKQWQVPVILGSATPSLESLWNVQQQRYRLLRLAVRAGGAQLPKLRLIDIRGEKIQQGVGVKLKQAMQQHLQAGNQVLLFLNRRGFAPVLMCHGCGWQAQCPSCEANMTLHQGPKHHYLLCHHCAEQMAVPKICPQCGSHELHTLGQGTERLEEAMQQAFPAYQVLRIDRDSTRLKGQMAELTRQAQEGEAQILIGTQMLAKGHHFPKVTLVGILEIDQGLFSCDYRATERMAQLILQVAGRAGREAEQGEVLLQTHHPHHPLLVRLVEQGYEAFAQEAVIERQKAQLPPMHYQCLVRCEAYDAEDAKVFLHALKAGLVQQAQAGMANDLSFWGPVSAPMLRRQGRYRYQLMLSSSNRAQLHKHLQQMLPHIYQSPLARKVRWSLDVDPQEMF
ncbi:MAG: primosomal protein N' [Thiotrichales bacterium]|nr:primosomal protein N' [Thiotrichales bacterium]